MEEKIQIETDDNHIIYGTLNWIEPRPDKLIIFVHGLTGHQNEHIFFNASKFFPKNGFTTFRFDLYSGEEKGRSLKDSTIKIHSQDLNSVIKYFETKFKEIFLVGHSLGGPTILGSHLQFVKSVVLWDPSLKLEKLRDELCVYNEKLDLYVLHWGTECFISKDMVQEWKTLDLRLIEKITKPTKIICAENGVLHEHWKNYIDKIQVEFDFINISNAGHCFDEEGKEEELFEETLSWMKK